MPTVVRHGFIVGLLCFCAQILAAQAQEASGNWILLKQATVATDADEVPIAMPDNGVRVLATRLLAKTGTINLKRVVVIYGNGQTHYEVRPNGVSINLEEGERTRPIDLRDEGRIVDRLTLTIDRSASNSAQVKVEVWALEERRVPMSVAAARGKALGAEAAPSAEDPYIKVPIFFGTTRARGEDRPKNERTLATFTGEQGTDMVLGRALVTVPRDHKAGEITRPEMDLIITQIAFRKEDPKRDFTIAAVDVMPKDAFVAEMAKQVAVSSRFKGQALIFIHGYNVSFDDAIFRAAQIAFDIAFDGPAVAFSWPSYGGLLDYKHDVDTAKASRDALRQLIEMIARDTNVTAINIIAHSMGNEPLIDVLREQADLLSRHGDATDFKLNEIVLAAPDVSRNIFVQAAVRLASLAHGGVTLYASSNDVALSASKRLAGGLVRAGDVPKDGIVIVPGVESIDISNASTSFLSLNHSTFADRSQLVTDMQRLFERVADKHPPDLRFQGYRVEGKDQKKWWQYIKN